jgi:hypothetical protein
MALNSGFGIAASATDAESDAFLAVQPIHSAATERLYRGNAAIDRFNARCAFKMRLKYGASYA